MPRGGEDEEEEEEEEKESFAFAVVEGASSSSNKRTLEPSLSSSFMSIFLFLQSPSALLIAWRAFSEALLVSVARK